MNGTPLGFFTMGTALGNTMGAIICTYLLRRISAFNNAMERTRDVTYYIALVCFLGTTVNAAFNVVGLIYSGRRPGMICSAPPWRGGCPTRSQRW
jgi:integral membrane sensor domain MASE1